MKRVPLPIVALFVAGYLCLDWVSYIHPLQQYSITPWNPQPALAIALLMYGGQRYLPIVFFAALAAEWLVRGASLLSPATLLVAAVLALGYAAIAAALSGRFAISPALETQRDAVRLTAVVAVGALATGVLYIAALLASGAGPLTEPFQALMRFWIGDTVGIMVTLPLLLMLTVPARRSQLRRILAGREAMLHALATVVALAAVVGIPGEQQIRFFYVLFLPLIAVATRFGLVGAALAALAIQAAVILTGELAGHATLTVFEFQAWLIALTVTGLFLGVTVDERRRVEEELRSSMRMAAAGEMAAALAHELNQPLTALSNYARASQLLAAKLDTDRGLLVETLGKLAAEAMRAGEVVRRLRDFFRAGTTRLAPVAIEAVAARVLADLAPKAHSLGVTLDHRVPQPLPPLLLDELQLEVVIRNLVANALEAAAGRALPGHVSVEMSREAAGLVKTVVQDNGGGIAAGDEERVFEAFHTTRAAGMGMGLAISRAIVEAHGGKLWAQRGSGGRFCFTLPIAESP